MEGSLLVLIREMLEYSVVHHLKFHMSLRMPIGFNRKTFSSESVDTATSLVSLLLAYKPVLIGSKVIFTLSPADL